MSDRQEGLFATVSDHFVNLASQIQRLSPSSLASLTTCATPKASAALPVSNPSVYVAYLARPETFSGDSGDWCAFLTQCELHFDLQATAYPTERSKIAYIISHLTGQAEAWATMEWSC